MRKLRLQYKTKEPKRGALGESSMQFVGFDRRYSVERMNEMTRVAHRSLEDTIRQLGEELEKLGFDKHSMNFSIGVK